MFKILAADKLNEEGLDFIRNQTDAELVNKPGLSEDDYIPLLQDADAMIVRSGIKVTAKMLEQPGNLKVIARAGVGVDNIDLDAATKQGILVVNTAEASTITTAEHAFTLMMALLRNVGPAHKSMTEGKWDRKLYEGRQLAGKTLGVVGFGRIGQTVAKRALAFEMNVVAYDPFINASTMLDGQVRMFRDFPEMLPHADILTFHVPLNDQTRGMLGKETFPKCRKGVFVVNAARGGVIDEAALIEALDAGQAGGAALDVYSDEPPAEDSPLRQHPKILCTPHLGASTKEAQQAVSIDAAQACLKYLRGEGISGAVNAGNLRLDLSDLQQRYVDLAGRMAKLISPMVTRGIARVSITLAGKDLHGGSSMIERQALVSLLKDHLADPVNLINVASVAEQRGIQVDLVTSESEKGGPKLVLEIEGPDGAVDASTLPADRTRRIVGRVFDDNMPRVTEINRYFMDMVPEGHMVLLLNEDKPGMIGLVGNEFGEAGVNIADMSISRRASQDGQIRAMMTFKVDAAPDESLLSRLKARPGILKAATVQLPPLD